MDHREQLQALHLAGRSFRQIVENMDPVRRLELAEPRHAMRQQRILAALPVGLKRMQASTRWP